MAGDKVAIVTGGINGIGRAVTLELARAGWRVVAFGLEAPQVGSVSSAGIAGTTEALDREGLAADLLEADVSNAADVARVVELATARYGRIDGLVNNAAIRPVGTILETSEQAWDEVHAVNLKGMFLCARAVLPQMIGQGGGAIVNVGSGAGWGKPGILAYSAAKGGIFAFSAALGYDHFRDHIRVNVVVPGPTVTGQMERNPDYRTLLPRFRNVAGRFTTPEDVAHAVAFLLSDKAEAISGAVMEVGCFSGQGGPVPPPNS